MMSTLERAILYLIRKKHKSIIMFAILTVIASLVFICVSIGNAAETASRNLRETMGGYFKITTNTQQGYYQPVDDSLVQTVLKEEGIKSFNGLDTSYLLIDSLTLTPGRFTAVGDTKQKLARFIGNTESSLNEYFILRSFSLVDGRHIKSNDIGKCLISNQLALENALSVGDTFTAELNKEGLSETQAEAVQPYSFEIVGIYDMDTPQASGISDSAECDIPANFIFVDTASIRAINEPVIGKEIHSYQNGAAFFVKDPKELEEITNHLLTITAYDWDGYQITQNNTAYNRSAIPLERVSSLLRTIIIALALISIILLSLILIMWMRDRIYEIGILLSIGIKKFSIIGQHISENLLIAILALLFAWGIANVTANKLGDTIFSAMQEEPTMEANTKPGSNNDDLVNVSDVDTSNLIRIHAGGTEFIQVVWIGFLIVIFSTGFSSVLVINMKPKDILSKLS